MLSKTNRPVHFALLGIVTFSFLLSLNAQATAQETELAPTLELSKESFTAERVGPSIPVDLIGEPVSAVNLKAPKWQEGPNGGYGTVDGEILPIDPKAPPIHFRVALPAQWSHRSAQLGGGGMNGMIPNLTGRELASGYATYGSDSGHQGFGFPGGPGGPLGRGGSGGAGSANNPNAWALNEEAVRNLGYMQLKKTRDAAMVIIERVYGERPKHNYFFGGSQGGREALTVVQRYPADYNGVTADVPIVNFSSLMLAPCLIRIQEKPLANWVTRHKTNAIRAEFLRQCDGLDGLEDGIINNYVAARALFDMSQGDPNRNPWQALRGPDGIDPNPGDNSASAKLSDGQIETLKLVYSRYRFATPLANKVTSFGMWVPNTDPSGMGLIADARFRGQEGAAETSPLFSHLGILGVTGFLFRDLSANSLDYVEGGRWNDRRIEISEWLDSTNHDLSEFQRLGGKMIVTIGTNDTLASPGAQLDYYQSLLDTMGREKVDEFARLFVIPQGGHGLSGKSHNVTGSGKSIEPTNIPNQFDKRGLIEAWVEKGQVPSKTLIVSSGGRSLPLCSYPNYPKYIGGPEASAESYESAAP